MTADQLLSALWRRRALVLAIAAGVFAVGAAVVATLPSVYRASAVVRVEPQRPSEEMVQRTVTEVIEQRVFTLRQELLSRPVLQRTIEELKLYPDLVKEDGMDAAVERFRKDLEVKIEGENAYELTVSFGNGKQAAAIANRLPQVHAEEAVKGRAAQAARATQLFNEEIDVLKKTLADWEAKIAQFKVDHMGELPEQLEMNMRGLERVGALLQTKSEELRVAETRRSDLARARNHADSEAGRLERAESELSRTLVAAQTTWTADHPELQRLGTELNTIQHKRQEAEGRMVVERQERARAAALVTEVQQEIAALHKQADAYQKRLDNTPRWAHDLAVMSRDYEITRAKYQSVISRKVEAELAQELEAKSAKSLFNVISAAVPPSAPAKPDRLGGLLISLLLGLGLGVLAAVVKEMRDDSIRDTAEIKAKLPLPVLAVVPQMGGRFNVRRNLIASEAAANQRPPMTVQ